MEILGWSLITVCIVWILAPWNEVAGGFPLQQDPTHPEKSSGKHEQPLYVDTEDYPSRGDSTVRKRQPLRVVKSGKATSNNHIIPWKVTSIPPVSNRTTEKSNNSQASTKSFNTSAVAVSNGGMTNKSSPPLTAASTESSDYDLLNGLLAEAVNEEDDVYKSAIRRRRMYAVFTRHGFMFTEDWFFHTTVTPPRTTYARCVSGHGYEDNKYCFPGEVCVDKDSLQPVECTGKICAACPVGSKPIPSSPCDPGCKPGANCDDPSPDGVCVDSTFGTDQYIDISTSEKDPSPMVFFGGHLTKNASCIAYGDAIDMFNRGPEEFNDKIRKLRLQSDAAGTFGSGICNWAVSRLQCIANKPRLPTTPAPPPPVGGPAPTDEDNLDRPQGSCQCMLALGEKAVAVTNKNGTVICYIPANQGYHSKCSHGIFLPYGGIDGVIKDGTPFVRLQMEPAAKFCVPNSECKPGYKYTGLRCMCKKKYVWEPKTSTCGKGWRVKPQSCSGSIIIFFALLWFFRIV